MNIFTIGISHKTAPIDIREKFYLTEAERELLISILRSEPSVAEVLILSTCNRTEIYANVILQDALESILRLLFKIKKLSFTDNLKKYFYRYNGQAAVEHLLRVSAGLDSIVLGEKQILGQVKRAIEFSRERNMMGKSFNVLADLAVRTGKKAQSETQIGFGGVSVSWSAVTVAQKRLGTLQEKSVLIIGAGKMGHLAASHLKNKKIGHLYVMNRSIEKAEDLADKFGGTPVSFWDIKNILQEVDVCICSVGAPHYIVEKDYVESAMAGRQDKELLCIDISIPRNIDPEVSSISGVSLITIDDLGNVVAENMEKRYSALSQVESIIAGKIEEYNRKISKIKAYEETGFFTPIEVA